MPQISPINWVFLSLSVLFLVFFVKVFLSFNTVQKFNFSNLNNSKKSKFLKWIW